VGRGDSREVDYGRLLLAPGVARLGFSAMVAANLECDVPGISPGLVTVFGDRVSEGRAGIISASILYPVRDAWSQH